MEFSKGVVDAENTDAIIDKSSVGKRKRKKTLITVVGGTGGRQSKGRGETVGSSEGGAAALRDRM